MLRRFVLMVLFAPAGCTLLFDPPAGGVEADAGAAAEDADPPATDGGAAPPDGATGFVPLCAEPDRVAHWRFEGDLSGGIADETGAHPGAIVTAAPMPVAGEHGQAGAFDAQQEGFVVVDDDNALDLTVGSIEVWVRYAGHESKQQVVARDAQFSGEGGHFRIRREQDQVIDVRFQSAGCADELAGDCTLELTGTDAVPDGQWTQIVVNFGCVDAQTCKVEFFVDGDLQGTSGEDYSFATAENPFVFGTDQGNAPEGGGTGQPLEYLNGAIDEIILCRSWVDPSEM